DFAGAVARIGSERDFAGASDFGAGKFVRMRAPDGRLLAASGTFPRGLADETVPSVRATQDATIGQGRGADRIIRYPVPGVGWSESGVHVGRELRALRRVQIALAGSAALLIATLAILAWVITTGATAEMRQLAAQLETLEAASLDRRLAPGRTTEVDRLVTVLNRMLGRLEAAGGHLRRFTADPPPGRRPPLAAVRAHPEAALRRGRPA